MNEFQAEIEATEEKRGRSILCRYCNSYHECDEDGTPQGMCNAEREHKRRLADPLHIALSELPDSVWHEVQHVDWWKLESIALVVERAAEQAEAEGHRFDAACDWLARWLPILRELKGAAR